MEYQTAHDLALACTSDDPGDRPYVKCPVPVPWREPEIEGRSTGLANLLLEFRERNSNARVHMWPLGWSDNQWHMWEAYRSEPRPK